MCTMAAGVHDGRLVRSTFVLNEAGAGVREVGLSSTGRASMSARRRMVGPPPLCRIPATPLPPMCAWTS
jgi:hypothetical protein